MSRAALATSDLDEAECQDKLGQLQHRSRLNIPCGQHHYNHVTLPLMGGKMEVTKDRAVFMKSPRTERRLQKHQQKQESKRPETAPELPRIGFSPHVNIFPPAGDHWPYDFFAGDACSQNSCESDNISECATESDGSSSHEEKLQNGVRRRVAEQVLVVNLKQLAAKQKIRYGHHSGRGVSSARAATPSSHAASSNGANTASLARQRVRVEATKFNELYANTSNILEAHMTLSPPSTRHSVTMAELRAYRGDNRSMQCSPDVTPDVPTKSYSMPAYDF